MRTFLFVCGGSAGHINPAIAIAEEMRRRLPESNILFVGADRTLEKKLVPEAGFKLVNIKMSGLRRGFSLGNIIFNLQTVKNLLAAGIKSSKLLKEQKPDAVIGTGGSICYPVLKRASKMGILTYVLEPNASPGLAVRMLSSFADKIFVTYKGQENKYKKPSRVVYTGTPLKSGFIEITEPQNNQKKSEKQTKPLVVSFWGSVGAQGMNIKIADFIKHNIKDHKFNHIHATGTAGSVKDIISRLNNMGINEVSAPTADLREYIEDMPTVMRNAEIVISRSGASTIVELSALKKPAILIPSPNVTENHQEENAKKIQEAGAALLIREDECTGDILYDKVISLLDDKNKLKKMSDAQEMLSVKDAAAKIVEIVLTDCESADKN